MIYTMRIVSSLLIAAWAWAGWKAVSDPEWAKLALLGVVSWHLTDLIRGWVKAERAERARKRV